MFAVDIERHITFSWELPESSQQSTQNLHRLRVWDLPRSRSTQPMPQLERWKWCRSLWVGCQRRRCRRGEN